MPFSGHRGSSVASPLSNLLTSSTENLRAVFTRCNFHLRPPRRLCIALLQSFRLLSHGACRVTDHAGTMKRLCKRSLVNLLQRLPSSFRYRFHPSCMFNYWPVQANLRTARLPCKVRYLPCPMHNTSFMTTLTSLSSGIRFQPLCAPQLGEGCEGAVISEDGGAVSPTEEKFGHRAAAPAIIVWAQGLTLLLVA
jgi:hypothetical protein